MSLWIEIIGELPNGFHYIPRDFSVEDGDIDADMYGFQHRQEEGVGSDELCQYWPETTFQERYGAKMCDEGG